MAVSEVQKIKINSWAGKIVHHFKGDDYLFIGTGKDAETLKPVAIYKGLYDDCKMWVRDLDDFLSECTEEQKNEYGYQYKFTPTINSSKRKEVK